MDEYWRTDGFELWCWRRLLRIPWRARRSNQSILKEINLEYSLEGLMMKLKLQYFGHLLWRAYSLEKILIMGKIEGRRRKGWQDEMVVWHHWLNGHEFAQTLRDGEGQGSLVYCSSWDRKKLDILLPSISPRIRVFANETLSYTFLIDHGARQKVNDDGWMER